MLRMSVCVSLHWGLLGEGSVLWKWVLSSATGQAISTGQSPCSAGVDPHLALSAEGAELPELPWPGAFPVLWPCSVRRTISVYPPREGSAEMQWCKGGSGWVGWVWVVLVGKFLCMCLLSEASDTSTSGLDGISWSPCGAGHCPAEQPRTPACPCPAGPSESPGTPSRAIQLLHPGSVTASRLHLLSRKAEFFPSLIIQCNIHFLSPHEPRIPMCSNKLQKLAGQVLQKAQAFNVSCFNNLHWKM